MSLRAPMAEEFSSDLAEKSQGFGSRLGFAKQPIRALLVHIAVIGVFGILLPWWLGARFLSPVTLTAYCCFGVLFAAPVSAEFFSADRPKEMKDALVRIAFATLYGDVMAIVTLLAGIATLSFSPAWIFFTKDFLSLGEALALGLMATFAMAAVSGLIAVLISSPAGRGLVLRVIFLALLILFFFDSQRLPEIVIPGIGVCAGVAVLALIGLRQLLPSRDAR